MISTRDRAHSTSVPHYVWSIHDAVSYYDSYGRQIMGPCTDGIDAWNHLTAQRFLDASVRKTIMFLLTVLTYRYAQHQLKLDMSMKMGSLASLSGNCLNTCTCPAACFTRSTERSSKLTGCGEGHHADRYQSGRVGEPPRKQL